MARGLALAALALALGGCGASQTTPNDSNEADAAGSANFAEDVASNAMTEDLMEAPNPSTPEDPPGSSPEDPPGEA